jgi:hypothetical protein
MRVHVAIEPLRVAHATSSRRIGVKSPARSTHPKSTRYECASSPDSSGNAVLATVTMLKSPWPRRALARAPRVAAGRKRGALSRVKGPAFAAGNALSAPPQWSL